MLEKMVGNTDPTAPSADNHNALHVATYLGPVFSRHAHGSEVCYGSNRTWHRDVDSYLFIGHRKSTARPVCSCRFCAQFLGLGGYELFRSGVSGAVKAHTKAWSSRSTFRDQSSETDKHTPCRIVARAMEDQKAPTPDLGTVTC